MCARSRKRVVTPKCRTRDSGQFGQILAHLRVAQSCSHPLPQLIKSSGKRNCPRHWRTCPRHPVRSWRSRRHSRPTANSRCSFSISPKTSHVSAVEPKILERIVSLYSVRIVGCERSREQCLGMMPDYWLILASISSARSDAALDLRRCGDRWPNAAPRAHAGWSRRSAGRAPAGSLRARIALITSVSR